MPGECRDTIFALASAPGRSGVALVRISGPRAFAVAQKRLSKCGAPLKHGRAVLRKIHDLEGSLLDQALVLPFRAPRSFTGEDTVEFHLHGSPYLVETLLRDLEHDAAPAEAGEFTRRAVENGKIDLAKAEALRGLIESRGRMAHELSLRALAGETGKRVAGLRTRLLDLLGLLEAGLDFSDAEIDPASSDLVLGRVDVLVDELKNWQASWAIGRLAQGAQVALVGEPNAGKSTLMNALAGLSRVIVDAAPGTTRDLVSHEMRLGDLAVTLWDTAGIRDTGEGVERQGIERSLECVAKADLVLCLVPPTGQIPEELPHDDRLLLVHSKSDLSNQAKPGATSDDLVISALTGDGMDELRKTMYDRLLAEDWRVQDMVILEERHHSRVHLALESLERAREALVAGLDHSLLCADLRDASEYLGQIQGGYDCEDVLDRIFSKFCIGK